MEVQLFIKKTLFSLVLLFCSFNSISDNVANWNNRYIASFASSASMKLLPQGFTSVFQDESLPLQSLLTAISTSLTYFRKIPPNTRFLYGKIPYTAKQIIDSLLFFKKLTEKYHNNKQRLLQEITKNFLIFASSANHIDQGVLFTGYYEPIYNASLKSTEIYNVPVYKKPNDLRVLRLGKFRPKLKKRTIVYRINKKNQILPYYTRRSIMRDKVLANRNLEIAWMKDPVELLFLQIQGSGILRLTDNSYVRIAYNGSNGRPYLSIGKYLIHNQHMQLKDVSMQSIHAYLLSKPKLLHNVIYHNPSFIFFKLSPNQDAYPVGNIGVPLTPERSIAIDQSVFPRGALSYLVVYTKKKEGVVQKKKFSHFSVAQDTGGAIRGAGHVDIFLGSGESAGDIAGGMRNFGQLYFLIKKPDSPIRAKLK